MQLLKVENNQKERIDTEHHFEYFITSFNILFIVFENANNMLFKYFFYM